MPHTFVVCVAFRGSCLTQHCSNISLWGLHQHALKTECMYLLLCCCPQAASAAATTGGRVPAAAAAAAVGVGCAAPERIMTTAKFLKQMGKKEGFKKEVQGFAARWVHGTGALHALYWACLQCLCWSLLVRSLLPRRGRGGGGGVGVGG